MYFTMKTEMNELLYKLMYFTIKTKMTKYCINKRSLKISSLKEVGMTKLLEVIHRC